MREPSLLRRGLASFSAAVILAAVVGCRGGSSTTNEAHLLVAYPAGLAAVTLDGAERDVIVAATKTALPMSPAVSPDGRSIAFLEVPAASTADNGADLWLADRDGAHARLLLRHPQPNHSIRAPAWLDGTHLLVVVDRPGTCDGCNPATTSEQELDRIDVRTGASKPLRRNVTAFDVSPDHSSVTYPNSSSERAAALDVASFAGGAERVVVPLEQNFAEITSPRFSPNGSQIAFAAADGRSARADGRFVSRAGGAANAPDADGLPENIWVVDASGQDLHLIASLREDQPAIAWSPDGASLFVIGTSALYRINVATGAVARIGEGAEHSQLAYLPAQQ